MRRAAAHPHELDRRRDDHGSSLVHRRAVPDLTVEVPAPAVERAIDRERARVTVPGADRSERGVQRDPPRHGAALVCPVAELARAAPAPAVRRAGHRQGAAVLAARAHALKRDRFGRRARIRARGGTRGQRTGNPDHPGPRTPHRNAPVIRSHSPRFTDSPGTGSGASPSSSRDGLIHISSSHCASAPISIMRSR